MADNIETMAYQGETPWHGKGVKLDKVATAKEAIKAAELDWDVILEEVYVGHKLAEGFKAVTRKKDGVVYAIMRGRYQPVQNVDAFNFFDEVVATGKAIYHTAGSLGKGERIWILAKLEGALNIKGDEITKFLLLSNSHNGTSALTMLWTPVRVVCQNTLQAALAKETTRFYARHTNNIMNKVSKARDILGMAEVFYKEFADLANEFARQPIKKEQMHNMICSALDFPLDKPIPMEELYSPVKRAVEYVYRLAENGRGNDRSEIAGTKWAAYNGLAEYTDYYRHLNSKKDGAQLSSIWFGSGNQMKQKAWDYLKTTI